MFNAIMDTCTIKTKIEPLFADSASDALLKAQDDEDEIQTNYETDHTPIELDSVPCASLVKRSPEKMELVIGSNMAADDNVS